MVPKPAMPTQSQPTPAAGTARAVSIDALRALVMFAMIYVNDIAGAPASIVPWWMRHFKADGNGMTFVDLVFPGFLFIVGMSIPFALGSRLDKGEPVWKLLGHVATRTVSLLALGILMVNGEPNAAVMGWSGSLWAMLMYAGAILAFCDLVPTSRGQGVPAWRRYCTLGLRAMGFLLLVWLAFAYRGAGDERIITLSPLYIRTQWYGILGLIGWAYLVGSVVFLCFRRNRTALLGSMALLLCLFSADRGGLFNNFWLSHYVGIGSMLGAHPAITVGGILLGTILKTPDTASVAARARFTGWMIAGCAAAACLLHPLYGINKNQATPSWCLWACAITAALWLIFYLIMDASASGRSLRSLALFGQNVLLAYLFHNMLYPTLDVLHLSGFYGRISEINLACAMGRSILIGVVILTVATGLNRLGFRLRL